MKTARDYILEIVTNKPNMQHIADCGKINGSLLIDLERAMKLYANKKLDEARQIVGTGTHENVRLGISALKDQI